MSVGLNAMDLLAAILSCAPLVSPALMGGIVQVESAGSPWAIFRQDTRESLHPASEAEAVATARRLVGQGVRIDGGLAQIDSAKWAALKLTVETVFMPCSNLAAAEELLLDAYRQDVGDLDAALSRFGAGDPAAGVKSGYVAAVRAAAGRETGAAAAVGPGAGKGLPPHGGEAPADETAFKPVPEGFVSGG